MQKIYFSSDILLNGACLDKTGLVCVDQPVDDRLQTFRDRTSEYFVFHTEQAQGSVTCRISRVFLPLLRQFYPGASRF